MYIFYSILLFLSLILYLPPYFVRIRLLRREGLYLKERLGFRLPRESRLRPSIWIHAVSVGEVLSLQNLVKKIKERHPTWAIHFSTLTNTGMQVAKEKLKDADQIFFLPLDFTRVVRKFFRILKPEVFVLAESEFWPNLLREAKRQTRGVILVNGRISQRSFKRLSRLNFFTKRLLNNICLFLVQTDKDKERLEKVGLSPDKVKVVSNLKSEVNLPLLSPEELLKLKRSLNILETKKVIVAGSTRKGEEKMLLDAYTKARRMRDNLLLILAPRHPQRFDEVERMSRDFPFKVMRKTQVAAGKVWDVLILDTLGELAQFYALSDIAFIGGSLVSWGGQNLLEPAFYEKPVFFGPHMENFAFLAEKFIKSRAAQIVHSEKELVDMFLIQDEKYLEDMGRKAKEALNSLQGATEKTIQVIETLMQGSQPLL
jgi:3-deoxy-D-manno-octulosonic-acid transferase